MTDQWQDARFFHGTDAVLSAGDILLPGKILGISNFSRNDHVYITSTAYSPQDVSEQDQRSFFSPDDPEQYAMGEALLWAHSSVAYSKKRNGGIPGNPHVYEVKPLGDVERDFLGTVCGYRTSAAVILQEVAPPVPSVTELNFR